MTGLFLVQAVALYAGGVFGAGVGGSVSLQWPQTLARVGLDTPRAAGVAGVVGVAVAGLVCKLGGL